MKTAQLVLSYLQIPFNSVNRKLNLKSYDNLFPASFMFLFILLPRQTFSVSVSLYPVHTQTISKHMRRLWCCCLKRVTLLTDTSSFLPFLSVGGAFALGIYTILFLKLYSYKDVNLWCRELSSVKAKKLARSLSCKSNIYKQPVHLMDS